MSKIRDYVLGVQHALAMFGSTVLVPYLTGIPTSLALIGAGVGTLIFHRVTKKKVPIFMGSSFAFITSCQFILEHGNIGLLKGAIISAGIVHLLIALIVYFVGIKMMDSILPPVIVGPIIMSIGLKLIPVGLTMVGYHTDHLSTQSITLALIAIITMVIMSTLQRSFFRFMPIITAIFVSYSYALYLGIINPTEILHAPWFGISKGDFHFFRTLPEFSLQTIMMVAPIAVVTLAEHIGEVKSNSAIVGKDFIQDPGLHRTLSGDGLATLFGGLLGGPAYTTYAENTGVLAATGVYDSSIIRKAAVIAIIIGLCGKMIAIIHSIPVAIMGGISLVLFGLISSIGLRILSTSQVDFSHYRNLLIPAVILIFGVFIDGIPIGQQGFMIPGAFCATILGIILNLVLPTPHKRS